MSHPSAKNITTILFYRWASQFGPMAQYSLFPSFFTPLHPDSFPRHHLTQRASPAISYTDYYVSLLLVKHCLTVVPSQLLVIANTANPFLVVRWRAPRIIANAEPFWLVSSVRLSSPSSVSATTSPGPAASATSSAISLAAATCPVVVDGAGVASVGRVRVVFTIHSLPLWLIITLGSN